MSIRIKVARSAEELDCVFKLRHRVYVEEEGVMNPRADGRITDRFDAFPTTVNFIALSPDGIVGNLRLCERTDSIGVPADEYFNFEPHIPEHCRKLVNAGMLCMSRRFRGKMRLSNNLIMMGVYWSCSIGASHVLAPTNPKAKTFFNRVGFDEVASQFIHKTTGLKLLPMILDLDSLHDRFAEFIEAQGISPYIENFEREFYVKGEKVIRAGENGDKAYFVVAGKARAIAPRPESDETGTTLNEIGEGELFGELALLTDSTRTADVVAVTDLDLMVFDRKSFQEQILNQPERSKPFLRLLAERWKRTTSLLS